MHTNTHLWNKLLEMEAKINYILVNSNDTDYLDIETATTNFDDMANDLPIVFKKVKELDEESGEALLS